MLEDPVELVTLAIPAPERSTHCFLKGRARAVQLNPNCGFSSQHCHLSKSVCKMPCAASATRYGPRRRGGPMRQGLRLERSAATKSGEAAAAPEAKPDGGPGSLEKEAAAPRCTPQHRSDDTTHSTLESCTTEHPGSTHAAPPRTRGGSAGEPPAATARTLVALQ